MKGGGFFDTKIAENTYNETTLNMTSIPSPPISAESLKGQVER
jgi:hypothetical protein